MATQIQMRLRDDISPLGQDTALETFFQKYCHDNNGFIIEISLSEYATPGTTATVIKGDSDAELNLTTNTACYMKVLNANDDAGGTGCLGVMIFGLRKNTAGEWEYKTEFLATAGIGTVALANGYCELLDAFPYSNGSGNAPAGDIEFYKTDGNTKLLTISAGELFSNGSKIIVPDGYYVESLLVSGDYLSVPAVNEAMVITYNMDYFGHAGRDIHPYREIIGANVQYKKPIHHDDQANTDGTSSIELRVNHLVGAEDVDIVIHIGIKKNK